jgi:predicted Rossmann-fold nucleotide-binding protein
MLSSVGVYCASSRGADPGYAAAAASLGQLLAGRGIRLVYGGAHVGLMGVLADATLAGGGQVHGVITRALQAKEIAHQGLTSLEVVKTRPCTSARPRWPTRPTRSSCCQAVSGPWTSSSRQSRGLSWESTQSHAASWTPAAISRRCALLASAARQGFILPEHRDMVITESDPGMMLDRLSAWKPVFAEKWLDRQDR